MHNNNKISKLIAWFMRSKWSHSALVFEHCEILDKDLLIETSDFQVGVNNLDRYIADPKVSMEVRRAPGGLNPEQAKRIVNKGYDLNEVMFGYDQLFSTGIKLLLLRWKFKIKKLFPFRCHVLPRDLLRLSG